MKISLSMFLMLVHTLCTIYPASVTSWIRTPKRNAAIGGKPESRHLLGMAVDIVPDDPLDGPRIIASARRLGLDAYDAKSHIHIEADKRSD
jgi:uncharacterized protein YcbK (DUF882 family)